MISPATLTGPSSRTARIHLLLPLALAFLLAAFGGVAHALKPIDMSANVERLDIAGIGEVYEGQGDTLQVETAPGADGNVGRMSVRASNRGTNPNWFVFALRNPTDKAVERWLTAERYSFAGSGIVWPELDQRRLENVTPSIGFVPERIPFDRADAFRLTVEPGQTITFAVELAGDRLPRFQLWRGLDYEKRNRNRQLFYGMLLGTVGLLAVFLSIVFAVNHQAIFPAGALLSWLSLVYLCVEFGLWHKMFNVRPEENAQYRAAAEAALAAALLIFLHVFLRLNRWHGFVRLLLGLWTGALLVLVAVAFLDPRLASTFARLSTGLIGVAGSLLLAFLAFRWDDRALALMPAWVLLDVWLFGASLALTGRLGGDVVVNSVITGFGLVVILLGFTVTQHAFRNIEPLLTANVDDQQLRALAIENTSAAVWEWNARLDEIRVDPELEAALGLPPGQLNARSERFAERLHPTDKSRFKTLLADIGERYGGSLREELRLRHADGGYRWFELEAAAIPVRDRAAPRVIGLIREVSDVKRAQERLVHDAVHDTLTSLPNRALMVDRLGTAVARARSEPLVRPTVFLVDVDRFKSINSTFGSIAGDSLLISTARRLVRHAGPQDTVARIGGDEFALVFTMTMDAREQAAMAEAIRSSLRSPVEINGQELVLTAAVGYAQLASVERETARDLLDRAEAALHRAKRRGPDQVAQYDDSVKAERDERAMMESELRVALERGQLRLEYQPIMYLRTEELAGFEALLRWDHPKLGTIGPADFIGLAEESDLIVAIGSFVLQRAVADLQRWQSELPRENAPLFASVNVSSRQLFRQDLVNEVRHLTERAVVPKGSIRLEVTESLVMENPEKAAHVLGELVQAGAELSLDDFGTGYSSLSYLSVFPFDTIKIDKAIVHAGAAGGAGSAVLRSIVALSHELGKKVVAEGVELPEELGLLRTLGCEYAQGHHCGVPMSQKEALQFLKGLRKDERRLKRAGLLRLKSRKRDGSEEKPRAPARPPKGASLPVGARGEGKGAEQPALARTRPIAAAERRRPTGEKGRLPPPLPSADRSKSGGRQLPGAGMTANLSASAVQPLPVQPAARLAEALGLSNVPTPEVTETVSAASASLARLQAEMSRVVSTASPVKAPLPAGVQGGGPQPTTVGQDLRTTTLPPEVAASLARLAGGTPPPSPQRDGQSAKTDEQTKTTAGS